MAYKIDEAKKCKECRTYRDDWKHDHNAYYVEKIRCLGCEKIEWEQRASAEEKGSAYGLKYGLVKPNA